MYRRFKTVQTIGAQHSKYITVRMQDNKVLIHWSRRWKWLQMYDEVGIVDDIKPHKTPFVLKFLQQFNPYCFCFNLISIYFTLLCRFYWGCAYFIAPISTRSEGQERRSAFVYWFVLSQYVLNLAICSPLFGSFIAFHAIWILFITTLRYSQRICSGIKYSSSLFCNILSSGLCSSKSSVEYDSSSSHRLNVNTDLKEKKYSEKNIL